MKEVILDTETTGLFVKDGHRIVEIGCIEIEDLVATKNRFHCYLNPERKVSEKALEVHGYTDEFLAQQKKFSDVVNDFLDFIENKRLVIHNAEFDLSHLNNELALLGKKKLIIHNAEFDLSHLNNELALLGKKKLNNENVVDTLALARDKFPGSPISLDALCKRYRIDNSKRTQHTALVDCDLLAKVYINLLDQKEPTLNFQIQDNEKITINSNKVSQHYKKIVRPTEEELKKHKEYLKNSLKKNYF